MMKITIVIPCYNSADTIGKVVDLTSKILSELKGISYDFVLVNDSSKDPTCLLYTSPCPRIRQ